MIRDDELRQLLLDDCPYADITTEGLGIGEVDAIAHLSARHDMTVCGVEAAARMFEMARAQVRVHVRSGDQVEAQTALLEASGKASALHRTYKVAQTLMEILSGIATATNTIVEAARRENPACHVVCTRKHMPGIKRWALDAIAAGGASPHRLGLSDYVLVFAEHRALLDEAVPLREHFDRLKSRAPERRLVAEADDLEEAIMLADAGAEIVQVDKMTPDQVRAVVSAMAMRPGRPKVAAAGGINATNAAAYAASGAALLVTSSPYYAGPRDVKVRISRA